MPNVRIPINIATDPFRRDRPIFVASVALGAVLTVLLIVQVSIILNMRGQSARTRKVLNVLNAQLSGINAQQAKLDATLREPKNAEVLERSLFLNTIIERKAISWTRIFSDLEKVMPPDVRLVSVRLPQVTLENQVQLDMEVGAKEPKPMLDLLDRLQKSPQFGPATVLNSLPPSQTEPLWRYRVSVNYAQRL